MMLGQPLNSHRILKRPAKALISLRVCAGWSESLPVAHTIFWKSHVTAHMYGKNDNASWRHMFRQITFGTVSIKLTRMLATGFLRKICDHSFPEKNMFKVFNMGTRRKRLNAPTGGHVFRWIKFILTQVPPIICSRRQFQMLRLFQKLQVRHAIS